MNDEQTRRGFLGGLVLGGVAGSLGTLTRLNAAPASQLLPAQVAPVGSPTPVKKPEGAMADEASTFVHPYDLMAKISSRKRQIWVVSYVGQPVPGGKALDGTFKDVEASLEGGADAVILINENMPADAKKTQFPELPELEAAVKACRAKFPEAKLGVNWLGDDEEPYGYKDGFRLAKENDLSVVWTDFSGVDLIKERPKVDLHEIKKHKPANVFYCSGIHMKYSHLLDPKKTIEESALEAMGWVDGIIVTGPKTGVASDPGVVKRARKVIGHYPLGVASGTTPENVVSIRDHIDFVIVHTGIQENHRIVTSKVKALRASLDG